MVTRVREDPVSTNGVRKGVLCLAVAAMASMSPIAASSKAMGSSTVSDASLAATINLKLKDLPSAIKWSPPVPRSPGTGDGRLFVACMKARGGEAASISSDLFGIVGKPSGVDTVDVESPAYERSSGGFPIVTSDVVFVTSAAQAADDLAAMKTRADLACRPKIFGAGFSKAGIKETESRRSRPSYGTGNGGVHVRSEFTGAGLPSPNYSDFYYYVDGRAEITIGFGSSVAQPFSSALADAVVAKIMTRAKSVLG
jgi:hypothetical protein